MPKLAKLAFGNLAWPARQGALGPSRPVAHLMQVVLEGDHGQHAASNVGIMPLARQKVKYVAVMVLARQQKAYPEA